MTDLKKHSSEMNTPEVVQLPHNPIAGEERIVVLDILRGLAIFGILIMNIQFFSYPDYGKLSFSEFYPGILNQLVDWLTAFFIQSKFYSMFSFLFGIGMAVLFDRSLQKNIKFTPFFSRRLLILLCIGLFHGFVIWDGDILMTYAAIGFALLAFKKRKQKTIMIWAISCLMVPVIMMIVGFTVMKFVKPEMFKQANIVKEMKEQKEKRIKNAKEGLKIYSEGSFSEQINKRVKTTLNRQMGVVFYGWRILGMFLLGLWAWRKKIFHDTESHIPLIKKIFKFGLIIGVIANLLYVAALALASPTSPLLFIVAMISEQFGAPALCLFYISAILLLIRNPGFKKLISPFAPIGRMALSNYLFHTLIFTTIFYSYGFGLYGKFGPAKSLIFVVLMYFIQMPLSNWWLKRFRFGPVEWLWRSLTYGKKQPMKLPKENN